MTINKIFYISNHPSLSLDSNAGYATHMRETISAFESAGYAVEVLVNGPKGKSINSIESEKYITKRSFFRFFKIITPKLIWTTLKDFKLVFIDFRLLIKNRNKIIPSGPIGHIIYERASPLQISSVLLSKRKNVFHVLEVNSPLADEHKAFQRSGSLLSFYYRLSEKYLLTKSDLLVFVSSALADFYINKYKSIKDKVLILPNAVNMDYMKEIKNKSQDNLLKQDYGLPKDGFFIGFVGSIFPWHGVDILIDAYHSILMQLPKNVHLLIVGDGEIFADLKRRVVDLEIEDRVFFTGSVSHDSALLLISIMEICVMVKSNWYGSPIKIFEYGLMQKAVIAPNVAPVNEVMADQIDGLLVNPNKGEIGEAFLQIINDSNLRETLSKNWHSKVKLNHTWDSNIIKLLNTIIIRQI